MTLEELLQNYVRGRLIVDIVPDIYDGDLKGLKIMLHSGRDIEIQCFAQRGPDAAMVIVFEGEDIQL